MKKLKFLISFFALSSAALACAMCSIISYSYCEMKYAIAYEGASAPASYAFYYLIPFVPAIIACAVCAFVFHKRLTDRRKSK